MKAKVLSVISSALRHCKLHHGPYLGHVRKMWGLANMEVRTSCFHIAKHHIFLTCFSQPRPFYKNIDFWNKIYPNQIPTYRFQPVRVSIHKHETHFKAEVLSVISSALGHCNFHHVPYLMHVKKIKPGKYGSQMYWLPYLPNFIFVTPFNQPRPLYKKHRLLKQDLSLTDANLSISTCTRKHP